MLIFAFFPANRLRRRLFPGSAFGSAWFRPHKKNACYETLFAKITGKVKHSVLTFQTISHEKKPNCQHFLLQDVPTLY